jgi:hypothetical protein
MVFGHGGVTFLPVFVLIPMSAFDPEMLLI